MGKTSDSNQDCGEDLLAEIEKARLEMTVSENAFHLVQNDPVAIDLAITRRKAAVEHFDYLIMQAKEMGMSLDRKDLIHRVLKY